SRRANGEDHSRGARDRCSRTLEADSAGGSRGRRDRLADRDDARRAILGLYVPAPDVRPLRRRESAMTIAPGARLGPYEVVAPLGAGGMGEVWRARDTRLARPVAIKVLPDRVSGDAEALARFEREAKVVAALSHPNILAIHDVGTEGGVSYAVTELLEGETLAEALHAGALPARRGAEKASGVGRRRAAAPRDGALPPGP